MQNTKQNKRKININRKLTAQQQNINENNAEQHKKIPDSSVTKHSHRGEKKKPITINERLLH